MVLKTQKTHPSENRARVGHPQVSLRPHAALGHRWAAFATSEPPVDLLASKGLAKCLRAEGKPKRKTNLWMNGTYLKEFSKVSQIRDVRIDASSAVGFVYGFLPDLSAFSRVKLFVFCRKIS